MVYNLFINCHTWACCFAFISFSFSVFQRNCKTSIWYHVCHKNKLSKLHRRMKIFQGLHLLSFWLKWQHFLYKFLMLFSGFNVQRLLWNQKHMWYKMVQWRVHRFEPTTTNLVNKVVNQKSWLQRHIQTLHLWQDWQVVCLLRGLTNQCLLHSIFTFGIYAASL